jgi:hypothetical protein
LGTTMEFIFIAEASILPDGFSSVNTCFSL